MIVQDKLEEKKPNTILWGSKPLSSGLLSPNGSQVTTCGMRNLLGFINTKIGGEHKSS